FSGGRYRARHPIAARQTVRGGSADRRGLGVVTDTYDLIGYRVAIAAADAGLLDACRSVLARFRSESGRATPAGAAYAGVHAADGWRVESAGQCLHSAAHSDTIVQSLEWQLVADALKHRADLFHVHGAALAPPAMDGAVVLAGTAGVGKTTLALTLVARG